MTIATGNWKPRFFAIWIGQQFSLVGSRVAAFALIWWVTATTGSATILASATLVAMLPEIVIAPFAGAILDRQNRQRIMILADGFVALVSAWLAWLFFSGHMQIWHVYVIMFARSLGGAFHWPAMQASTSMMVPDKQLARVAGLNSTMMGIMGIAAPPLGALLVEIMPMYGIMLIDVATAAFAIAPLFFVHIPQPVRQAASAAQRGFKGLWQDMREGFSYVRNWSGLFQVLLMATVLNFILNPAGSLLPILVTRHFGGGAIQLATANSAWGVGVVVGGLLLGVWGGFKRRIVTSMVGIIGLGVGCILIGFAPAGWMPALLVGSLVMGFMNPITNGPLFAIMQSKVEPAMQGRVFTVVGSLATAMSPLSLAVAGPLSDWLGVQVWYAAGGIACLLMALIAFTRPSIMGIEQHTQPVPVAALSEQPLSAD